MLVLIARALHGRYKLLSCKRQFTTVQACSIKTTATARATPEGNRLPRALHQVLPEPTTRYRRIIIIGDIHGCGIELRSLLDKCSYRKGVDIAISVGDLVNKGKESLDVLKIIKNDEMFAVRGNHDDAALAEYNNYLKNNIPPSKEKYQWVTALKPNTTHDAEVYSKLVTVLEELPFSLSLPGYGVTVVHAGMVPGIDLEQQQLENLIKMRDVVPTPVLDALQADPPESESDAEIGHLHIKKDKDTGEENEATPLQIPAFDWEACIDALNGDKNNGRTGSSSLSTSPLVPQLEASERRHPAGKAWASVYRGPNHCFFGHDASRKIQLEPWATGLDGGCVYGGAMYAAILPALDENGKIMEGRAKAGVPFDAQEITLGTGLTAWLVNVPATAVHSPPKIIEPAVLVESKESV